MVGFAINNYITLNINSLQAQSNQHQNSHNTLTYNALQAGK